MYKVRCVVVSNLGRVITKLGYMGKEHEKLYNKGGMGRLFTHIMLWFTDFRNTLDVVGCTFVSSLKAVLWKV